MKFGFSGIINFGTSANLGNTGIKKIRSFFNDLLNKENEDKGAKDPTIFGAGEFKGSATYKAELDISAEEMVELFKLSKDYDLHTWDLLKKMGNDLMEGTRKARHFAEAELPQWQQLVSDANIRDSRLTESENKEYWDRSQREKAHREGSTRSETKGKKESDDSNKAWAEL